MAHSGFNRQDIIALADNEARQKALITHFNQAIEAGDDAVAAEIAAFCLSDDEDFNIYLPAGFEMYVWYWFYAYNREGYSKAAADSEEEDQFWYGIIDCLWKAKSIAITIPNDLRLSKEDIDRFNEDILEDYQQGLFSLASLHKALMEQSIKLGDIENVHRYFKLWQESEEDNFADCEACQQDSLVVYYHFIGEYAKALEMAEPILTGKLSCGEVPHVTYYPAVDSLIRLDKTEEANFYLDQAVALIRQEINGFAHLLPRFIQLYSRLGEENKAMALYDEFNEMMIDAAAANELDGLQYLIALAPYNEQAKNDTMALAAEFDQRNGNQYYQVQLELMLLNPKIH